MKYTAREDAGKFKDGAIAHLRDHFKAAEPAAGAIMLDWRRDYPGQWNRFLNPTQPADGNVFEFEVVPNLFPARDQAKNLAVEKIQIIARCVSADDYSVTLESPADTAALKRAAAPKGAAYGDLHEGKLTVPKTIDWSKDSQTWQFRIKGPNNTDLSAGEVQDVTMIISYSWSS